MKVETNSNMIHSVLGRYKMKSFIPKSMLDKSYEQLEELQTKAAAYDSQSVQNAIECDRIERKLLSDGNRITWSIEDHEQMEFGADYVIVVNDYVTSQVFRGKTKLESLTKALEWVEGDKK